MIRIEREDSVYKALIILLIFISLAVTLYCQYPSLKYKFVAHTDIDTYIFPIYNLQNKNLFKDDLLAKYILLTHIPKGYLLLLLLLGNFFNLIFCFKSLPFILTAVAVVFLFLVGKKIKNNLAGFIMAFLFLLHSWTFHTFQGASPRAFVYPLLIPFLYFLIKKKYLACFWMCVIQIFFYPPIALISLFTLFFSLLEIKKCEKYIKFRVKKLSFLFVLVIFFLMGFRFIPVVRLCTYLIKKE